jgi:hypothetical protein
MSAQKYRLEIFHASGDERPTCVIVARGDLERVTDEGERLRAWCGALRIDVLTWRKRKLVASIPEPRSAGEPAPRSSAGPGPDS